MQQSPILNGLKGGNEQYDGQALMNEVFDLMSERLSWLPPDDGYRPVVEDFLTALGPRLGRDPSAIGPTGLALLQA